MRLTVNICIAVIYFTQGSARLSGRWDHEYVTPIVTSEHYYSPADGTGKPSIVRETTRPKCPIVAKD